MRDRLCRLCEEWNAFPAWLRCCARSYDFLLRCTFCTRRLPAALLRLCSVAMREYGSRQGRSVSSPPNRMSIPSAVCTAPSHARVRVRAPQSVFDFFLHLFIRVRQLLDSKKDRGEDFVRKWGDFLLSLGVSAQFSVDVQGSMVERRVNLSVTDDLMKSIKVNQIREFLFKCRHIIN